MTLFSRLFWIFEKGKAHKDLEEAYSQLNELAGLLNNNIIILHQIQKELVSKRLGRTKYISTSTGAIGLEKTLFIEESFIKTLKDPHINVTIKLFGGHKKDIHLLLAA